MVDYLTIGISFVSAIIGASLGPWVNHKLSIRYLKKEHIFKEKISLFEKMGALTWKNHLALTVIEQINNSGAKNPSNLDIIKLQINSNIKEFAEIMNKLIYLSSNLRINLGKYISSFEDYVNDKEFGKPERTKKVREDYQEPLKNINKIIEKEIKEIK